MSKEIRFIGRTRARSHALQLLFQAESRSMRVADIINAHYLITEGPLEEFARTLALGADAVRDKLDALIADTATNWNVTRLLSVDRNIIRLALFEMLHVDDVDVAVTINEFVILAKAYGTDDSAAFVNGVLGQVARRLSAGEDIAHIYGIVSPQSAENASVAASTNEDASGASGVSASADKLMDVDDMLGLSD